MYQQNNSFVYIHIGVIVYVEENVRLRYCDGKDKYFPHTRIKDVKKYIFDKTACQTLNSVSRMVN
jgi:hypothetical protein